MLLFLLAGSTFAQALESDSDEAGLAMQVARAEDDIRNSAALIRDTALNDYVRDIACRVAAAACPGLRVYLVTMPGMDVSALPNGALVISSGALLRTGNEAELAHLLAHEIAHYLHKDPLHRFHRMLDTSGVVAVLGVAASGIGMGFVGTPASMAALGARYGYSRGEEETAQRNGLELAVAAGYDPDAAAAIWRKADEDYLKRHPAEDPEAHLKKLASGISPRASRSPGSERHAAIVAPFLRRWVEDEFRQDKDMVGLFTRLSNDGGALFRYGLGEAYRKRGGPGDMALAEAAYRAALASPDAPPIAWRGLGLMAMQTGDQAAARTAFAQYREASPDADDKAMIDYYLKQP